MTTSQSVSSAPTGTRGGASRYFRALRIPVTLVCLMAAAFAAYYFFYVTRNTTYLIGRDLRLLATAGAELQALIDSDVTVLSGLLKNPATMDFYFDEGRSNPEAFDSIPVLRSVRSVQLVKPSHPPLSPLSMRFMEEATKTFWSPRIQPGTPGAGFEVSLSLKDRVQPLLTGEIQSDIFDSLALTTAEGRVIFQTGDPSVNVTNISKLLQRSAGKVPAELGTDALTHSAGVFDVVVSGSPYKLFVQPCCDRLLAFTSTDGHATAVPGESGWLVVAFVHETRLSAAGAAIPFSVVGGITAVLLLVIFSWPFVKFLLIGELQRITVYDALLVGVCALMGVSFVTLFAFDVYGTVSLTDSLDAQLETLSKEIRVHVKLERERVTERLEALEQTVRIEPPARMTPCPGGKPLGKSKSTLAAGKTEFAGSESQSGRLEVFTLIDRAGCQLFKHSVGQLVTPLTSVAPRAYFTHWLAARPSELAFVEPVRSFTTGKQLVVFSKRARGAGLNEQSRHDPNLNAIQVAALTVPMRSLLNPVLIDGFGFVILAEDGRVLFHSDPEHNLSEDFFAETDQNRRLRALVAARQSEWVNLNYWADPHRAFVTPMDELGWSLVTFYDRVAIDTVRTEWFVTAVAFTLIYCAIYVLVGIGTVILRPSYRAPWLWPDPAKAQLYLKLISSYFLLAIAWIVSLSTLGLLERLWIAWLIPMMAWVLTFVALAPVGPKSRAFRTAGTALIVGLGLTLVWMLRDTHPLSSLLLVPLTAVACAPHLLPLWNGETISPPKTAPPLPLTYGLAAGILLVVVAVLPAAMFFTIGHGVHAGNLVRYSQLRFGLDLSAREQADRAAGVVKGTDRLIPCTSDGNAKAECDPGIYHEFFFCSRRVGDPSTPVCAGTTPTSVCRQVGSGQEHKMDTVPDILEGILPYYSESAVRVRELMHGGSADNGWNWENQGRNLTLCLSPDRTSAATQFVSMMPSLAGSAPMTIRRGLAMIIGLVAVTAVVIWIVRFALKRVFVMDLTMPLWAGQIGQLPLMSGPNLFVLSKNAISEFLEPAGYFHVNLADVQGDADAQTRWFEQRLDELAGRPPEESVLISHFEGRMYDQTFNDRKLSFIERLIHLLNRTVMVVSSVPPQVVLAAGQPSATAAAGVPALDARWTALLAEFSLVPIPSAPEPSGFADQVPPRLEWGRGGFAELLWRTSAVGFYHRARFLEDEQRDSFVKRVWMQILPFAWQADRRAPLDLSQLLVEVGERLENYYRGVLASCSASERVVLAHVAADGLVNEKDTRIARVLMGRGLLRRQPNFQVINETFRRFVLSTAASTEMKALEHRVSAWDSVRWPSLIMIGTFVAVFFGTQRELFNQTFGVISAVAAGLPVLIQLIGLLTGAKRNQ